MDTPGSIIEVFGVRFGYLDPRTLAPHPLNFRTHPERQKAALQSCIAEHGWVQFPIYNEQTRRLIDGHARVEQARKDGLEGLPCVLVSKSEASERRLLASIGQIERLAGTEDHMLARLLRDCLEDDGTLPAGYSEDDLAKLLLAQDEAHIEQEIARQAEPEKPVSRVKPFRVEVPVSEAAEFSSLVTQLGEYFGTSGFSDTVIHCLRHTAVSEGLLDG